MVYRILNIHELNIDEMSGKVSKQRIDKSDRFKYESDKIRSIAVEYLLNEMILEFKTDSSNDNGSCVNDIKTPVDLSYDANGKPHILDGNGDDIIQFSLSHSGDYVACIISDKPCGIDIERHSDKRDYDKIAHRICKESELELIHDKKTFYDIWTLKESVMKAVGLGLSLDMRSIVLCKNEILDGEKNEIGKYSTAINESSYVGEVLKAPEGYSLSYIEKDN